MNSIFPLPLGFVLYSEQCQYTIVKIIGRGSTGYVYLADSFSAEQNSSCQVALKEWAAVDCCERMGDMSISYQHDSKSEVLLKNFMNEYTALSNIQHPHVVSVYECIYTNGTYYYAMEYLHGGTLSDYIAQYGWLSEDECIRIISQIASGLEMFHQFGFVHSDLKLSNIAIRDKDDFVLIDGGAMRADVWTGRDMPDSSLSDIISLANILLCLLSGTSDPKMEFANAESLFVIAKTRGNMSVAIEYAIRTAFSAGFSQVYDFICALEEGTVATLAPQGQDRGIYLFSSTAVPKPDTVVSPVHNDTRKAFEFLGKMRRMRDFYISELYVTSEEIKKKDIKDGHIMDDVQKVDNWFQSVQDGFVLGLRLPSPDEFFQFAAVHKIQEGKYLVYEPGRLRFFEIDVTTRGLLAKIEECHHGFLPKPFRFYYACDLDPLIADSQRIHPFANETQVVLDYISPASVFGFCKVIVNNKWGLISKNNWVSAEIECRYDKITDIAYIAIPAPGPLPPLFLGSIAYVGDQIDVYELAGNGHLHLKTSMTQTDWKRRSSYS